MSEDTEEEVTSNCGSTQAIGPKITLPTNNYLSTQLAIPLDNGELLRIEHDGRIVFNHENYPNLTATDFAKEFVGALDRAFFQDFSFPQRCKFCLRELED